MPVSLAGGRGSNPLSAIFILWKAQSNKILKEAYTMKRAETTLVRPKLLTLEDYVKQREKSRKDFEKFVEQRNANRVSYFPNQEEKKRM